jgi:TonB family protein
MLTVLFTVLLQAQAPAAEAAGSTPETAAYATRDDYRLWPSPLDWYLATPQQVHSTGASGRAVLLCKINSIGDLARCKVVEEAPSGLGFGRAAMKLRSKMKMVVPPAGQDRWVLVPFRWDPRGPYLQPGCC